MQRESYSPVRRGRWKTASRRDPYLEGFLGTDSARSIEFGVLYWACLTAVIDQLGFRGVTTLLQNHDCLYCLAPTCIGHAITATSATACPESALSTSADIRSHR